MKLNLKIRLKKFTKANMPTDNRMGYVYARAGGVNAGDLYLLSAVGTSTVALVNLHTGNRWTDGLEVAGNSLAPITKGEWRQLTGSVMEQGFKLIGRLETNF